MARKPTGSIAKSDFEIVDVSLPPPVEGEVLVCNRWISLDPYMRLSMRRSEGPMVQNVGAVMAGGAVGIVEQSRAPGVYEGHWVLSQSGWTESFVAPAATVVPLGRDLEHPSHYLGILGLSGLTAWTGVEDCVKPQAGETIYVSGAAGAVGSLACQLAKRRGARVLGSAGTDAKCAWLEETIGIDAAYNYRTGAVSRFLTDQASDGLQCGFDNVGGETLDAMISAMAPFGRIGICGAISQYESDDYRHGPDEFFAASEKSLSFIGFNGANLLRPPKEILEALTAMVANGDIIWRETVVEGLENAPAAFVSLFEGGPTGKLVIRV